MIKKQNPKLSRQLYICQCFIIFDKCLLISDSLRLFVVLPFYIYPYFIFLTMLHNFFFLMFYFHAIIPQFSLFCVLPVKCREMYILKFLLTFRLASIARRNVNKNLRIYISLHFTGRTQKKESSI